MRPARVTHTALRGGLAIRLLPVPGFPNHVEAGTLQQRPEPLPDNDMVIGK